MALPPHTTGRLRVRGCLPLCCLWGRGRPPQERSASGPALVLRVSGLSSCRIFTRSSHADHLHATLRSARDARAHPVHVQRRWLSPAHRQYRGAAGAGQRARSRSASKKAERLSGFFPLCHQFITCGGARAATGLRRDRPTGPDTHRGARRGEAEGTG